MNQPLDVSFITVNYNGFADTCELIDSLTTHVSHLRYEIIVVDNASQVDEANLLNQRYPQIRVVRASYNFGFAGGNNFGISIARGRYLFFINNDAYITDSNVSLLVGAMDAHPDWGILCPKIRFSASPQPIQFMGYTPLTDITLRNQAIGCGEEDNGQYTQIQSTPYPHGAAMLVRAEAIQKVGLMCENYFLYYEEIDWGIRFTNAGYKLYVHPDCTVYHKESQSTGQHSPLRCYYLTRNRLWLAHKYRKGCTKLLAMLYLAVPVCLRNSLSYLIHSQLSLTKATLHGTWDGVFNYKSEKMNNEI